MRYQPVPTEKAYCYDGPLLLRQFGPDPNDAADVLETYPWCGNSDPNLILLRGTHTSVVYDIGLGLGSGE